MLNLLRLNIAGNGPAKDSQNCRSGSHNILINQFSASSIMRQEIMFALPFSIALLASWVLIAPHHVLWFLFSFWGFHTKVQTSHFMGPQRGQGTQTDHTARFLSTMICLPIIKKLVENLAGWPRGLLRTFQNELGYYWCPNHLCLGRKLRRIWTYNSY